ncbi:MAG: hypothetical protein CMO55_07845 [Verrucomicrobiales bacterium]|nr:hypothetical protein [Verrucomicrobiales bacterium]
MDLPFKILNLEQIAEIGLLTDATRAHYARHSESGFHSADNQNDPGPPEAERKRNEAINDLSLEARQELIALYFFGRRIDRNPRYWNSDLRTALTQLNNPNVLDTDNLHDYLKLALKAFGITY